MMRAKIIAKDHDIITYTVNGKVKRIIEKHNHPSNRWDKEVFHVIDQVGFDWTDVTNYLDGFVGQLSNKLIVNLERATLRHTI